MSDGKVIFTVAVGAKRYAEMAKGLARSLDLIGETTPRAVVTDQPGLDSHFQHVLKPDPDVPTYLQKFQGLRVAEAKQVLFLDADSLAFMPLEPIFRACAGHSLAVQGYPQRTGHWYGHLEQLLPKWGLESLPRFNGGLIYYEPGVATERLFSEAQRVADNYEDTGLEWFRGQVPDEPCLSLAMARSGIGTLFPDELDWMNTPVGLIGKLHMDVFRRECHFLKRGTRVRLIRPRILHVAKHVLDLAYWKELDKLEKLERLGMQMPYGHLPKSHRLLRSFQRRWLDWFGKRFD